MSIESLASFECVELEGESYDLRREHNAIREAERSGCEVFRGDSHTLVFDLDSEEARDTFLSRCDFLRSKFGMTHLLITKSTGGNYHAVAELHESLHLTQELALVIQACMGSDWKKELLGALRKLHYNAGDSLLFRPKVLEVVYEWRVDQ